jgi:hypothetical protein
MGFGLDEAESRQAKRNGLDHADFLKILVTERFHGAPHQASECRPHLLAWLAMGNPG